MTYYGQLSDLQTIVYEELYFNQIGKKNIFPRVENFAILLTKVFAMLKYSRYQYIKYILYIENVLACGYIRAHLVEDKLVKISTARNIPVLQNDSVYWHPF